MHARAVRGIGGPPRRGEGSDSSTTSRRPSATPAPRTPALLLTDALETAAARPGDRARRARRRRRRAAVPHHRRASRRTGRRARSRRRSPTARPLPYGKFLSWRGKVTLEPPRRPEPDRISASVSGRSEEWKYAFVGSRDHESGELHLPPARVSRVGDAVDDMEPAPMADVEGTIATVHHRPHRVLAEPADRVRGRRLRRRRPPPGRAHRRRRRRRSQIGDRVEMTFRKLFTADEIHNYFWKARPVR